MLVTSNDVAFLKIVKDLSVTLGVKTEMVITMVFLMSKNWLFTRTYVFLVLD